LKILVLSHLYPSPEQKISGIFVHEQVKALRKRGIDARVVTWQEAWVSPRHPVDALIDFKHYLSYSKKKIIWVEEDTVPVYRFPCLFFARCGDGIKSSLYSKSLQRILPALREDFPFDIIHAHTSLLDGAAAADIKERYKIPFLLTEHTGPLEVYLKTSRMRRRVSNGIRLANTIFSVSDFLTSEIKRHFPHMKLNNLMTLGNGVDTDIFHLTHHKKSPVPKALWVGQFYEVKQPLMMIEAIRHVVDAGILITVDIAGAGPLEQQIRQQIDKLKLSAHINLIGQLSRKELAQHMSAADFLILSSKVETFSLVTAEALCCGTPVLSTRCGGPEELIQNDRFGRFVDSNDERSLAKGIEKMISNLSTFNRKQIAQQAQTQFNMQKLAEQLESKYVTCYSH
jgi:glycosyltransferase involved in cell wall biosynthesis